MLCFVDHCFPFILLTTVLSDRLRFTASDTSDLRVHSLFFESLKHSDFSTDIWLLCSPVLLTCFAHLFYYLYEVDIIQGFKKIRKRRCSCDNLWLNYLIRAQLLTQKLLKQGHVAPKLKSSLQEFYGRHHNLVDRYEISISQMA